MEILRKSIDARQRRVVIQLKVGVHLDRVEQKERVFVPQYRDVSSAGTVVVVGAGPAGLFAALRLIELGKRPIVLERGKCVEERKQDLNRLYKTGVANEDSNYGFGKEGPGRSRMVNCLLARRNGGTWIVFWKSWSITGRILIY